MVTFAAPKEKSLESIKGKGENVGYLHFLLQPQFSTL